MKVPEDFVELCDWVKECPDCAANEIWTLRLKLARNQELFNLETDRSDEWQEVAQRFYDSIKRADKDHDDIRSWLDIYDIIERFLITKEKYRD
jgi:hypothetical protein